MSWHNSYEVYLHVSNKIFNLNLKLPTFKYILKSIQENTNITTNKHSPTLLSDSQRVNSVYKMKTECTKIKLHV